MSMYKGVRSRLWVRVAKAVGWGLFPLSFLSVSGPACTAETALYRALGFGTIQNTADPH